MRFFRDNQKAIISVWASCFTFSSVLFLIEEFIISPKKAACISGKVDKLDETACPYAMIFNGKDKNELLKMSSDLPFRTVSIFSGDQELFQANLLSPITNGTFCLPNRKIFDEVFHNQTDIKVCLSDTKEIQNGKTGRSSDTEVTR